MYKLWIKKSIKQSKQKYCDSKKYIKVYTNASKLLPHMYGWMDGWVDGRTHAHPPARTHARTHACMLACMYVCIKKFSIFSHVYNKYIYNNYIQYHPYDLNLSGKCGVDRGVGM